MAELELTEQQEHHVKVTIKGRLDTEGVGQLETRFNATVCPAAKHTILDMSGVTFLSSMGIRMLVSASKTLSRRGARMVLLSPKGLVRESILSASLDQIIALVDSDEDAVRVLAQG